MAIKQIPIPGSFIPMSLEGYVLESKYIKSGYIVVQTLQERDALLDKTVYENRDILTNGTPVFVYSENKTYRYNATTDSFIEEKVQVDTGYVVVDTLADRNNIENKFEGLHVYVNATESVYIYKNNSWIQKLDIPLIQIAGTNIVVIDGKLAVPGTNEIKKDNTNLTTSHGVFTEIENTVGVIYTNLKNI